MKIFTSIILLLLSVNIIAQKTFVPDDNFEQALIDLFYDEGPLDDSVLTANINTILSLNVDYRGIVSLLGIEDFTALESLYCHSNQLTSLDISSNTNLFYLNCKNNQLTNLVVSNNTALKHLYCYDNQIISLDVSNNPALFKLYCDNNEITSLDLSNNSALQYLYCFENLLTNLDIRNGSNQNLLWCWVDNNPQLECIYVDDKNAPYLYNWIKDSTAKFVNNEDECTASTNDLINNTKFSIYPNPTSNYFYFKSENITILELNIYSHSGQEVFSKIKPNAKIEISKFKPGLYIVEIISSNKSYLQKLVIK